MPIIQYIYVVGNTVVVKGLEGLLCVSTTLNPNHQTIAIESTVCNTLLYWKCGIAVK